MATKQDERLESLKTSKYNGTERRAIRSAVAATIGTERVEASIPSARAKEWAAIWKLLDPEGDFKLSDNAVSKLTGRSRPTIATIRKNRGVLPSSVDGRPDGRKGQR